MERRKRRWTHMPKVNHTVVEARRREVGRVLRGQQRNHHASTGQRKVPFDCKNPHILDHVWDHLGPCWGNFAPLIEP